MKLTKLLSLSLMFLVLGLYSCDTVNNLLTQDIPFTKTFSTTLTNEHLPQNKQDCADLSNDKSFSDNKDKLDGISFVSLKVTLKDYNSQNIPPVASATIDNISFAIKFNGDNTEYPLETVSNVKATDLQAGKVITLGSKYDNIATKIKTNPNFCLISKYGNVVGYETNNKISGAFDLELKMNFKVKL